MTRDEVGRVTEQTQDGVGGAAAPSIEEPVPVRTRARTRHPRWVRVLRWRARRVDLLVAVLLAALGFGAAVQVRTTRADGVLASARQEDLVRILDDLSGRNDRLRQEVSALSSAKDRLTSAGNSGAALAEAQRRSQLLGVLAGTEPAHGSGIVLTIDDPAGAIRADTLLDALEELRDAGADAVQIDGAAGTAVRVVASTALVDGDSGVLVDGVLLKPPYRLLVVGDPGTLASAMGIPGGVVDTVEQLHARATVERPPDVLVGAVRPIARFRYAQPLPGGS